MRGSARVIAVVMIAGLLFCISSVVSADPTVTRYLNDTTTPTNDRETILFNWTGESETLGAMPDLGYINLADNISFEVGNGFDGGYGLVIDRNYTLPAACSASWYIGHYLTGVVNFSFDVNIETASSMGYGIKLNLGENPATTVQNQIEFLKKNATHGLVFSQSQSIAIEFGTWHHVAFKTDYDAQTVTAYLDGAEAWNVSATVYGKKVMNIVPSSADYNMTMTLDNLAVSVPSHEVQPFKDYDDRMAVALMFDDSDETIYDTAYPLLEAEGIVATLALDQGVGQVGTYTWADVQDLIDAGWGVTSHSVTHDDMTTLSESEKRYEFSASQQYIIENTTLTEVRGWTYPGHDTDFSCDIIGWEYYSYLGGGTDYDGMLRYGIDCPSAVIGGGSPYGLLNVQRVIPAAVYGHYGAIFPFFHAVVDEYDPYVACNITAFEYWLDKLTENNTRFVTSDDVAEANRNGINAILSGDADGFALEYPTEFGNYTQDDIWVRGPYVYGVGSHLINNAGEVWNFLTGGEGAYSPLLSVTPDTYPIWANVTIATSSAVSWSVDDIGTIAYTLHNLDSSTGYKVYQDGEEKMYQPPGYSALTFTAAGGGEFEVRVWDPEADATLPDPIPTDQSPKTSELAETSFSYTSIGLIAVACASTMIILLLLSRRTKGPSRSRRS